MDFYSVKQKLEQAAKSAVSKSTEIFEISKLRISIAEAESEINRKFQEIGKALYDAYKKNDEPGGDISEACSFIDAKYAEIEEKNAKIFKLRNMTICPNCKSGVEKGAEYCSKCGQKV